MNDKELLHIEERNGYLWIVLPDSITMHNNKEIEHAIAEKLNDRKQQVVLDFSNTQTVYSSGLGLMIRIRRFVTERGGMLSLVNVNEQMYNMFVALNIDKVFTIFLTDVEFEISQTDFVEKSRKKIAGLLFIAKIEHECYRIHLSGEMTGVSEFSYCRKFEPSPVISRYLLDLSGLEMIDAAGVDELSSLTKKIAAAGGTCSVYGMSEIIQDTVAAFGADKYMKIYADENSAFHDQA